MTRRKSDNESWAEATGGFRGSDFLRAGSVALAVAALANLASVLLSVREPGTVGPAVTAAWVLHIVALWGLGAGFGWTGAYPFLTRIGLVVGALHAVHGAYLLLVLFAVIPATGDPAIFTVGRLLATILFAVLERDEMGPRTTRLLALTAGLQLAKVLLRVVAGVPGPGLPVGPLLDAALLVALAAALFRTAQTVRLVENEWAAANRPRVTESFAEFNNPEHEWNKEEAES